MAAQDRNEPPAPAPLGAAPLGGFRADINGLRAIAVLAVVAYHFSPRLAPGGFLGVDVFFVISGYLMTAIIVGRMQGGRFRLWRFYGDRARRIVPALAAMCAVVTLAGAFVLDPWTYQRLAADIPAALLFVSNLIFASRSGYFAPAADSEWLLHTWSLAVEWQFYLTYPLLLMLLGRTVTTGRRLGWWLAGGLAVSFAGGWLMGPVAPAWAFYSEPTRAWELLAGGLCAVWGGGVPAGPWGRRGLQGVGLALIALSLVIMDDSQSWPSPWTAVPVLGAALVLLAGLKDAAWARFAPVDLIGRSSYSTYIWHWPLIVLLRYEGVAFTPAVIVGGVALCLALGILSYWLIERRLTDGLGRLPGAVRWGLASVSLVAVAGFAAEASATQGFEAVRTAGRPAAVLQALRDDRAARADWIYERECGQPAAEGGVSLCRLGDPTARDVLVIGDSHAQMLAARYAQAFSGPGAGLSFLTRGGCAPAPGVGFGIAGMDCVRWTAEAYRYAETSPYRRVVIVAAWPDFLGDPALATAGGVCFADADRCRVPKGRAARAVATDAAVGRLAGEVSRLVSQGRQVVLIGPLPVSGDADPMTLYRRAFWSGNVAPPGFSSASFERTSAYARARLAQLSAAAGAIYVDPLPALCPGGVCPVTWQGRALYKDARHYRGWGMADPEFAVLDPWFLGAANETTARGAP